MRKHKLSEEQIKTINSSIKRSWNEGLFTEPWAINAKEKRLVIYQRVCTGGAEGGSCWDTDARPYTRSEASEELNNWEALDKVLEILSPNITYPQYKKLMSSKLVNSNEKTQYEYYGNYDDYIIRWIVVEELIDFLEDNNIK